MKMKGRIRILCDSFAYQDKWTLEGLIQLHVPSVFFKTEKELKTELDQAVVNNVINLADGIYTLNE